MEKALIAIITALLLAVLKLAWKKYIVPIWIELFIEKIKIYKVWTGDLKFSQSETIHKIRLELTKLGNTVDGHIEFISGPHIGKKYPVNGRYHANILTFYYYPKDPKSTSQGVGAFQRLNDGELFKGHFAYYSQSKDLLSTVECNLKPTKTE